MEEDSGIVLQPLNLNRENNDNVSSPSTAKSTSVKRSGISEPNSPSTKIADLSVTSDASITIPSNDSIITLDRPNNVVTNFISEIDPKNNGPFNISMENIFKNIYYILAWYFFSTALSFYNKNLMGKENFNLNLPLLVSAMHTGMHCIVTMILMNGHCSFIYKRPEGKSVSVHAYFTRVVPCAIAAALEICMANASLVYITLSFYTMVKSSTPIWVLMFAFLFGLEQPRLTLIFIITIISFGVILTVAGETKFNLTGFILVLGAAVVSGLRWSLTQMLLQKEEGMNNPIATLYYLSPVMFIMMTTLSLLFENPFHVFETSAHFKDVDTGTQTFLLMLLGGLLAFCMTIAEFSLIKNTSTVTLSVAGISKEVVVISLSVLIYHDVLTPTNLLGLVISISGIVGYNYYKIRKTNDDKKGRYHALPPHKNED